MTCVLLYIIRMIKLRMIWAEHVTRVGYEDIGNGEFHLITGLEGQETLDGVCCQGHAPAALSLRNRPGTHCIEGWVGHRAGLDG